MHTSLIASCLCWSSLVAYGQSQFGSLSGSIQNADHAPVANIPVEAKNVATGTFYKATSSARGEYAFTQLPAGSYEISVLLILYRPFLRKDFAVPAGQNKRLDIQLSGTLTGTTLGELPAFFELFSKRPPPPKGPTPKTPEGKPDFSGVWMTPPQYLLAAFSQQPELQPWAEAVVRERLLNEARDKPSARCLPDNESTEPFVGLLPVKIVQVRSLLVALIEDVIAAHQIFLDGRGHPKDLPSTWMGHSIGKWDGDTLVIDTIGFNDKGWLFVVTPHTEQLRVITRIRRPDLGHLEIDATYDDPGAFKMPMKVTVVDILAPDEELDEVVCENNQYTEHVPSK